MKKLAIIGFIFTLTALSIFGVMSGPQAKGKTERFEYNSHSEEPWSTTINLDKTQKVIIYNETQNINIPVRYTIAEEGKTSIFKDGEVQVGKSSVISLKKGTYSLKLSSNGLIRCICEHEVTGKIVIKK